MVSVIEPSRHPALPVLEPMKREAFPLGAVSRHLLVNLHSGKLRLRRPLDVEAIEFRDGSFILCLSGTHVCAFGQNLPEARSDLLAAIEGRHALLERLARSRRALRAGEFDDLAMFRSAFSLVRSPAGKARRA